MRIVDAHAHIFPRVQGRIAAGPTRGLGYGRIQVGPETIQLMPAHNEATVYSAEMLMANMDWAGVERSVLLQGPFYGECNDYAWEAAQHYPDRLQAVAYLDPWREDLRAQWAGVSSFAAVKMECSKKTGFCGLYPGARLDDPKLDWLWSALEVSAKVLGLDLGHMGSASYQTGAVRRIATLHEGLQIVIAHLGQPAPQMDAQRLGLWREQVDLGRLANVYFDTAALPAYLGDELYPYPTMRRWLEEAIGRIGPAKVLWGTDQPGLLGHANLPQLVRLAAVHFDFLSADEQAMVMGLNALSVYG